MSERPTPRTDAEERLITNGRPREWVSKWFAGTLEQELAEALSQRDALLEALSVLVDQADRHGVVGVYWDNARVAIAAVKGGKS